MLNFDRTYPQNMITTEQKPTSLGLLFLAFLFMSIWWPLVAQETLVVQVLNSETERSIAFANVYFTESKIGKTTDLDGFAIFNKTELNYGKDMLEVSFVGYQTQRTSLSSFSEDTIFVRLSRAMVRLPEVQVSSGAARLSGRELIEKAINSISKNYPQESTQMEGLYREMIYENQRCAWLNEALLQVDYEPYPQKNYARKSWKAYWDEQFYEEWLPYRQYRKTLLVGHPQFFKYYNSTKDRVFILSSRKSENLIEEKLEPELWSGPSGLIAADKLKFQADFLDPKLLDEYEYTREAALLIDSIVCIAVNFKPVELSSKIHQMWQEKISFPLFSGTVYLALEDLAVVRFECRFANPEKMNIYQVSDPWQIFPERIEVRVNYEKSALHWFPRHIITEQILPANSSEKWNFSNNYRIKRELYLIPRPSEREIGVEFRDIHRANLRDLPVPYKPELWDTFSRRGNYPKMGDQEITDLERITPLEKQYMIIDRRN